MVMEHQERILKSILSSISQCQNGQLNFDALEKSIAINLSALDTTFPSKLRQDLDGLVSRLYKIQTKYLDDIDEDRHVADELRAAKVRLVSYIAEKK
jgi:hypothetical protein